MFKLAIVQNNKAKSILIIYTVSAVELFCDEWKIGVLKQIAQ